MKKNKLENLLYNNRYVLLSFFSAAGVMLIIYMITGVFLFGDNTVLRMDLYHQYGPLFAELYDKITQGGSFLYSWESGLGSCFLGNYFNYLSSPIGAIVLFFGHENVPEAIGAMVLIKAALSAGTFTYYLKKSQRNHSVLTATFGILYAFCAYMLAYYWNVMWLDCMVLLPLVLLGIERIIRYGKIWIYVFSLSLSMFSNYYMSYMLCLFAVIYFFYYYIISSHSGAVLSKKFASEHSGLLNKLRNSKFFRSCLLFGIGSLLAGGLMAFALLPTYNVLQQCSATSGSFPSELKTYFNFFDFCANHLASLKTTIRSSGDDVLPNVYCGVLTVILAPLYFFTKSISKKEKVVTLGLLGIFYLSFNLNYLNYIWHGFHFPNDLPYRFSFMYSFILLVMAYKTFIRLNEFTSKQIGAVGVALTAFIFLIDKVDSKNVSDATIYISLIFIVLYVVLLTLFKDKRYEMASLAVLLCICVCGEAIISDTRSFPNNITASSYESDYSDFQTVKEHLDTIEQDGFYRMELTNLRTRMDPSWFGYNGVSVFSSMAYESVAALENRLGMMSNVINSYTYNPQTPVYNLMHSLKYIVNNETPDILSEKYYEHVASVNNFDAYENKYYLPIAYCVDSDILDWDCGLDLITKNVNPFAVQGDWFSKATGSGDPFEKAEISYVNYNNIEPFYGDLNSGVFNFKKSTNDQDGSAIFYIKTKTEGNIYIYFHVDGASEKDIVVNSSLGTIMQSATHDCILDLGRYKAGETLSVTVPFESNSGSMRLWAYTMNDDVFEKGYQSLTDGQMLISEFDDTRISGRFTAKNDCVLYTSIPYDEGWTVTIDGKDADKESVVSLGEAFIAVKVSKGNHEISFSYTPKGLNAGIKISVVCAFIILLMLLWTVLKKKRKSVSSLPSYPKVNNAFTEKIIREIPQPRVHTETVETIPLPPKKQAVEKEIIYPVRQKTEIVREVIAPKNDRSDSE